MSENSGRGYGRTIRISVKESHEQYAEREHAVSMIHRYLGSPTDQETMYMIFMRGIQELFKEMGEDAPLEAKRSAAIQQKLYGVLAEEAQWNNLNKLYDKLPPDDFQEWCTSASIDVDQFLEWRERQQTSWKSKAIEWLQAILQHGQPMQTDAIKKLAIQEGILQQDKAKEQWGYLKVIAFRLGYTTGERGVWQYRRNSKRDPGF